VSRTNLVCATYLFKYDERVDSIDAADGAQHTDVATAPVPDLGLVDAMAQLSFLMYDALAEIAAEQGLSIIQMRLLGVLRDREPTMNALGRYLGLDKSSITGLVDRAQRRDLVARTVSAADRRVFLVSITDNGRQIGRRIASRFSERVAAFAAGLSPGERRMLSRLATRIVAADVNLRGFELHMSAMAGQPETAGQTSDTAD
jgi:DNA-binding MarR family transcriptional regulator